MACLANGDRQQLRLTQAKRNALWGEAGLGVGGSGQIYDLLVAFWVYLSTGSFLNDLDTRHPRTRNGCDGSKLEGTELARLCLFSCRFELITITGTVPS